METVHIIPSMATSDGGPTEVVRQLNRALRADGHESRVITTDKGLAPNDAMRSDAGIRIVRSRAPRRLNFAPGIRRLVDDECARPETILHIHAVDAYTSTVAMRRAVAHNVPFVLQPHGAYDGYHRQQNATLKKAWLTLLDRSLVGSAAAIVVSSEREAKGVLQVTGRRAHVIPLGVDDEIFACDVQQQRDSLILFLGRLTAKKRPDIAIRAFAESGAARAGWRMAVAGPLDPRLPYSPSKIVEQEGLGPVVDLVGGVDARRRLALLAKAKVFVLPSEDESFGVSVAEAMAAGAAVIASTQVGIAPEAASAGALCLAEPTVEAFARKLGELTTDDASRERLASNGRAYAEERLRWSRIAAKFVGLYREVGTS